MKTKISKAKQFPKNRIFHSSTVLGNIHLTSYPFPYKADYIKYVKSRFRSSKTVLKQQQTSEMSNTQPHSKQMTIPQLIRRLFKKLQNIPQLAHFCNLLIENFKVFYQNHPYNLLHFHLNFFNYYFKHRSIIQSLRERGTKNKKISIIPISP